MELDPSLDPSVPVHLTKAGILKDGELNHEWFAENVEQSRRAVEFGKAEMAREMVEDIQGFLDDH